jgi:hypothetical protein
MQTINLNLLEYSWTAEVELKNGQIISILHTAWCSTKHIIKNIISILSDYPKHKIIENANNKTKLLLKTFKL